MTSRKPAWRGRAGWLIAACALGAIPVASAVEGANTPGLSQAVEAAWQRAAEARRAEGETLRADAGRRIARSFAADGPSLTYARDDGGWYDGARAGSGRETEIGISWPLWMPGQRRAAMDAARADVGWADAHLAQARLVVAGQVREAAWDVAARQAGLALVQARVGFLGRLSDDVARRVGAGDLARTDALSARADLLAAEAELADAQRALHASQSEWKVLTGLDTLPDADEIENEAHVDVDTLIARAGPSPALAAAEQAVRRAEGEATVARRSLGAPPELSIGAKEEQDGPGARGDRSVVVSLSVPLGVGARRTLARAQAQTGLDVANAELTLARSRQAADLEAARLAIDLADRQLESERQRAGLMTERMQLMEQAFAAGEIDLATLLLTTRQSAEADADLARRQADHGLAHARLLQVIGMLP